MGMGYLCRSALQCGPRRPRLGESLPSRSPGVIWGRSASSMPSVAAAKDA